MILKYHARSSLPRVFLCLGLSDYFGAEEEKNARFKGGHKPKIGSRALNSVGVQPLGAAHLAAVTHIGCVYGSSIQYRETM